MGKVVAGASMSLDGYVAGPDQTGFDHLFTWYNNGDVEMPVGGEGTRLDLKMSAVSAKLFADMIASTGALVVGRFLYDQTNAWNGQHPMQCPVVVLTHNPPEQHSEHFVFVTEGIEAAVAKAKELAGGKDVGLNSGTITRQALQAGLVDEIEVDLVPVILGGGTPFFGEVANAPVKLTGPVSVREGIDVTHLRYLVTKA
ncbi:dihydrofolate reductase family protein [Kibdelosporangium aridum]|uniref:dihydrofolate reductase family protein n=1 Tax=Kibdelosporangium aridum TaxID=2030 RepID=UPI000525FFEB